MSTTKLQSLKEAYKIKYQQSTFVPTKIPNSIAIVGGGIAGLYSALLYRSLNISFHIFEINPERLGGRIFTYKFSEEKNQYFDAGAMRIPDIPTHEPIFKLVDYVNQYVSPQNRVVLSNYILSNGNNFVFVNGVKNSDGSIPTKDEVNANPAMLNFPLDPQDKDKTADALLREAIQPFVDLLNNDFDAGFQEILKYDDYSMRSYLKINKCWSDAKIDYVEVMTSQRNQFALGFAEIVMEYIDFDSADWKQIEGGTSKLVDACAEIIGAEHISLGTKITKIEETLNGEVILYNKADLLGVFDAVLLTMPVPALRMLDHAPRWSYEKEQALAAMHVEPLYKIGLQFKTSFWENETVTNGHPSYGGVAITDYPITWINFPSYGMNETGPGVLMSYIWTDSAFKFLPLTHEEQKDHALHDLSLIYGEIVYNEFMNYSVKSWALDNAQGTTVTEPGQLKHFLNALQQPEGNIYFAGEYASPHHGWIVAAIYSALEACNQMTNSTCANLLNYDLTPYVDDYGNLNIGKDTSQCIEPQDIDSTNWWGISATIAASIMTVVSVGLCYKMHTYNNAATYIELS